MRSRLPIVLALLALSALLPAAATAATGGEDERLVYTWQLRKLGALVGGILVPGRGEGSLTLEHQSDGHVVSELTITSPKSEKGEFYRYGAEIDPRQGHTVKAWSSYLWRGKSKSDSAKIDRQGVIDIASGIYRIRQELPRRSLEMTIWSDGKIYPVVVLYSGEESRELAGGRWVNARHYMIRGRKVPGEREWKGDLELWLAKDEAATPIEIQFNRSLVGVRLQLATPL